MVVGKETAFGVGRDIDGEQVNRNIDFRSGDISLIEKKSLVRALSLRRKQNRLSGNYQQIKSLLVSRNKKKSKRETFGVKTAFFRLNEHLRKMAEKDRGRNFTGTSGDISEGRISFGGEKRFNEGNNLRG